MTVAQASNTAQAVFWNNHRCATVVNTTIELKLDPKFVRSWRILFMTTPFVLLAALIVTGAATAEPLPVSEVEGQPLAANAQLIVQALDFSVHPLAGDLCTKLQIVISSRSPPQIWDEFSEFLTSVRSISMDTDQSGLALKTGPASP